MCIRDSPNPDPNPNPNPNPNKVNYLRLTLARKHRFVLNFTASPLVEGSTDDLHVTVHLATETGGAAAAQTALRLEVAGYAGVPIVSAGAYVNASPAGHWELLAGAAGGGVLSLIHI